MKTQRTGSITVLCTALLFLLLSAVGGETLVAQSIPQALGYQGILVDADGIAWPNGNYELTFRIYDAPNGGAPLWQEAQSAALIDGVFDAQLGSSIPIDLPFDRPYWLAVELAGESEMTPRIQLLAVPYAMNARRASVAERIEEGASGVVGTINGAEGNVEIVGGGNVTVTRSGSTITVSSPVEALADGTTDGQIIRWDVASGSWVPGTIAVERTAVFAVKAVDK